MAFSPVQPKRNRQPQGPARFNAPVKFDIAWTASQARGTPVGPGISAMSATMKATASGLAISNGYATVVSTAVPSLYTTSWTEVGSVLLDGSNAVTVLSARADGQPVRFVPGSNLVSLVMWAIVDVDISGGVLPVGIVNYVVRRNGSAHTVWLNGKLYGSASDGTTPGASSGVLPAIGAQAGSGGSAGGGALAATTGVLMVARTRSVLTDEYCKQLSANPWQLWAPLVQPLYFDAGGAAAPSGTFASTLDGVVLAAAGIVENPGVFASTLGGVSLAATGTVGDAVTGTFASTLSGVSMAASGTITNVGSFSATLAGVTLAASGTVAPHVTGTFASTLDGVSMSASGFVGVPPVSSGFTQRRRMRSRIVVRGA